MPLEIVGGLSSIANYPSDVQFLDLIVYYNASKAGGAGWDILANSGHESLGVASITSGSRSFTVNYDFTATEVLSFTTGVDETLGAEGCSIGTGPVGLTAAVCQLQQEPQLVSGQVTWNGSTFVPANQTGNLAFRDYGVSASGELRLLHDECSEYAGQLTMGPGNTNGTQATIHAQNGGQTVFKFYNASGTLLTTGATTMDFFLKDPLMDLEQLTL